jgi:hypothetical protein
MLYTWQGQAWTAQASNALQSPLMTHPAQQSPNRAAAAAVPTMRVLPVNGIATQALPYCLLVVVVDQVNVVSGCHCVHLQRQQ